MKILIIYQSKYGSTRQYAQWINEVVESDITDIDNAYRFDFSKYDIIVLGAYFHASHIKNRKYVIDNWDKLKNSRVILFSVSGSPAEYVVKEIEKDFPEYILDNLLFYSLRGRSCYEKMTLADRVIMHLGRLGVYIAGKKEVADNMLKDYDYVSKENIKVITDKISELTENKILL
jgi:menaquinone-dependent protoporphyrinogen IX oxidase